VCKTFGYVWIKVAGAWVKEHHAVWKKTTGNSVPRGWVLHHKDGNKENNALENLELMTRGQHASLHKTGSKLSEETKQKMSSSAIEVAAREGESEARSSRAKIQHEQKNFGRHTWSEDAAKSQAAKMKGRPGGMGMLNHIATPDQIENYRNAAKLREQEKKQQMEELMKKYGVNTTIALRARGVIK
jgi:hypothetical protein